MPPQRFEVVRRGDPEVAHIGDDTIKIRKHNKAKILAAIEVCNGCPVWAACLEDALPSDRFWTVRGGEVPKYYPKGLDGPSRANRGNIPSFPAEDFTEYRCKSGTHQGAEYQGFKAHGGTGKLYGYCIGCDNEANQAYRAVQ